MTYVLAFPLALFFLFCIICLTTLKISIHFIRDGKDDRLITNIRAWFGLLRFQNEVSIIKFSQDLSEMVYQTELESAREPLDQKNFKINPHEFLQIQHRLYDFVKRVHHLHAIAKIFLRRIYLDQFQWYSNIGTGDAAETGVLAGLSWGVKSSIAGVLSHYLTVHNVPEFHVQPFYEQKKFETELRCMIQFRLGNAMLAGLRMLLNLRKGRDHQWQNTPYKA